LSGLAGCAGALAEVDVEVVVVVVAVVVVVGLPPGVALQGVDCDDSEDLGDDCTSRC
jgi:hypothetical protein